MSYLLYRLDPDSEDDYYSVGYCQWPIMINLAQKNGWIPKKTLTPLTWDETKLGEWNGSYFTNNGQIVTFTDARALASALKQAADTIGQEDQIDYCVDRDYILHFVTYCQSGGFGIC